MTRIECFCLFTTPNNCGCCCRETTVMCFSFTVSSASSTSSTIHFTYLFNNNYAMTRHMPLWVTALDGEWGRCDVSRDESPTGIISHTRVQGHEGGPEWWRNRMEILRDCEIRNYRRETCNAVIHLIPHGTGIQYDPHTSNAGRYRFIKGLARISCDLNRSEWKYEITDRS